MLYTVFTVDNKGAIAIIDFPLYVKRMHENQDYPFSREFEVPYIQEMSKTDMIIFSNVSISSLDTIQHMMLL